MAPQKGMGSGCTKAYAAASIIQERVTLLTSQAGCKRVEFKSQGLIKKLQSLQLGVFITEL